MTGFPENRSNLCRRISSFHICLEQNANVKQTSEDHTGKLSVYNAGGSKINSSWESNTKRLALRSMLLKKNIK